MIKQLLRYSFASIFFLCFVFVGDSNLSCLRRCFVEMCVILRERKRIQTGHSHVGNETDAGRIASDSRFVYFPLVAMAAT